MNIFDLAAGEPTTSSAPLPPMCSRKGCRARADWQLLWNNPKIHTPERRKIWLACSAHRQWLEDYLQTRGLWKQTAGMDAADFDDAPASAGRDS